MKNYQNILVVRTDRIGDVVLTTPLLAALRQAYPKARLSILISPQTRDIVEGNPYLDEIIVDDRKGPHKGLGFFYLAGKLKRRRFDLAIILHTKRRTNLLCFFTGIPHRIGYKNNKFGFLLTHRLEDTRPKGTKHEAEYCLDVLRHLGAMVPPADSSQLLMPARKDCEEWAERFLKENSIGITDILIAIHPGASCISKRWPASKFVQLIEMIQDRPGVKIVLVGGVETKKISEEIHSQLKQPVMDVTGKISLGELAGLLKRCRLLISNDSGPVHVAVAVGAPVISIFGRNQAGLSPNRWRPLGPGDIVLHKEVGCEICLAHNCVIGFECLEAISPKEVFEACQTILAGSIVIG